jgi:hypothetical protein
MWLFLRSKSFSIHSFSSTMKISSATIDCQSCATRWKIMRIDFLQTFNKKHTYESKLMMMLWSIWSFVFSRIRLNRTRSRMKSLMICIKYSTIWIVVLTSWKLIVAWNRSNRLKISTSFELNFSDWRTILSCIIKKHFSKISRTKCLTNCKKFSLSSRIKSSIYMNLSKCVDTLISHWEMWTISSEISKKILLMMLNAKKSLSSLIRIKIIRSIKTSINRSHVHDLKSLNRVFVRLLNHQKSRWTVSIVKIVKNLIIFFVTVVNLENQWISTTLYKKWMYKRRTMLRRISNKTREKSNFH